MAHHIIEYDCICESCKGTGLYKGIAERDKFAVVCYRCNGTGCFHGKVEYDDFKKRLIHEDVEQVLEVNVGIVAGVGKNGEYNLDSFGGMRYKDWLDGKPFPPKSEMRAFVCPAWWYQSANYVLKPDWCHEYDFCFGSFSSCPRFQNKELCWQRFDSENAETNHTVE
jgi:hypothetical protein